jgi:RNA polymerase sigma-70 factor (ECF subfamily)
MGEMEEIFVRFSPMVFSIGLSILKSREDAEDVVQDIFANKIPALMASGPALGPEEMGRYLAVTARNLAIDRYRRRRRFPQTELNPEVHEAPGEDGRERDLARMEAMLRTLTPQYREVLTLKYLLQMTWEDVSSKLGLSSAGARKRADQAKKALGEKLGETEEKGEPW